MKRAGTTRLHCTNKTVVDIQDPYKLTSFFSGSGVNLSRPPAYLISFLLTLFVTTTLAQPVKAADILVDTTADDYLANPDCSLREAIQSINTGAVVGGCINASVNSFGAEDTIFLSAGFFNLAIPQAPGGVIIDNQSGDLNIRDDMRIIGAGPGLTVISAKGLTSPYHDRVLTSMLPRIVTLQGMTIESGFGDIGQDGLLVRNASGGGTMNLVDVVLRDASGISGAAAVYNKGLMTLNNVALLQTRGTRVGAIHNDGGTMYLTNVTLAATTATNNRSDLAGVLYNNNGTATLTNVTIFKNRWGIYSTGVDASTILSNTVLAGNGQNCRGDFATYRSGGSNWSDDNSCASIANFGTHAANPLLSDLTFTSKMNTPSAIITGTVVVPPYDDSPLFLSGSNCPATDQAGVNRATACTSGAYEGNGSSQAALSLMLPSADHTVSGVTYLDYNANGTIDPLEPSISGITITAHLPDTSIATLTDGNGIYTLTVPSGTPVRIELSGIPEPLTPGAHGNHSGTTVQFVISPAANVNFALTNAAHYCQENPTVATNCTLFGNQQSGDGVLVSFPYNAGSNVLSGNSDTGGGVYDNPPHPTLATDNQIGTTWGLAYQRSTDTWFAASFMKRHAGFGPTDAPGTIYAISPNSEPTPLTTLNAGTNAHPNATTDFTIDAASWDAVGKRSLGDMDIGTDDETLYAINLADKQLYSIPISAPTSATSFVIPTPSGDNLFGASQGCSVADDVRPFAVGVNPDDGLVYVGMVCSAEASGLVSDLRAYVYAFDGTRFGDAPVLEFALDYPRGHAYSSGLAVPGEWLPWEPDPNDVFDNNVSMVDNRDDLISYPQPILADIDFDYTDSGNGDMILSFMDRLGHQQGQCIPWLNDDRPFQPTNGGCDPKGYVVNPAGDLLRACPIGDNQWALESNARCGNRQTAGANNGQGPANEAGLPGEFYFMDEMTRAHREVTSGGILQLAGRPDVASIVFDPIIWSNDFFSAGVHWSSNQTGTWQRSYRVFDTQVPFNTGNGTFGKSNALGDLEAACLPAPIEIGNRVWYDADGDGIQDPAEPPIADATINLYSPNGDKIATAVTAGDGSYYFSSGSGISTRNAIYHIDRLGFDTDGLQIRLNSPNDYVAGGAASGCWPNSQG